MSTTTLSTPRSRILIVEDDPTNIQVLMATLKEQGYQINIATNGKQALDVVAHVEIDLILLDVIMPEMDGFETCRRLKASRQWQKIPVIFLTAKTDTADIVKGFELGAVDYVGKPFNVHELLARVNTHLTIDRLHRENEKLLLESVRSFEQLRAAQARLLVSETAASQGRLAAVLSHELNSPVGSLHSAVQSLLQLYKKKREPDDTKLAGIFEDLAHTALESCQRLKEVVARMQRFTNLDRAEEQTVDVNELLRDTIGLLQSELNQRAPVVLDLRPLSPLKCRPRQLTAVFLNLLRNALAHLGEEGKIYVTSLQSDADIAVQVCDNGRGISAERLPCLFEPTFTVREGRVVSANWGLFSSRNIILEHDGQITIDSTEGKGTTVTVTLPAPSRPGYSSRSSAGESATGCKG
jgi:DNA-binding response OmpR family regulator